MTDQSTPAEANRTTSSTPGTTSTGATASSSSDAARGGYQPAGGYQAAGYQNGGYQQSGSQQGGYQAAGYQPGGTATTTGYGQDESKTLSIVSLVAGIASWVVGGGMSILIPIVGIVLGVMGRKREPAGRTMATWGMWLSIASLVVGLLIWILLGGFIIAAITAGAASYPG